jgi:hypothetical protein
MSNITLPPKSAFINLAQQADRPDGILQVANARVGNKEELVVNWVEAEA